MELNADCNVNEWNLKGKLKVMNTHERKIKGN
jgi:hypothetical protein